MSTIRANTIQDASGGSNAVLLGVASPPNSMGFRNRIINGDMRIDQRNNGATVTPTVDPTYVVDRFYNGFSQASKMTVQQQTSVVPAGFSHAMKITVAAAVTPGTSDFFIVGQPIEANNVSDLGFGTANAQTVTLSFRVNSSVAGTYSGVLKNSAQNRSYPFTFVIPSANTWTTISVSIPGDTTGTWLTSGNGMGIALQVCLGGGATYLGTAGAWASTNYVGATGTTQWISTAGATFYITGVQLEAGTVATPFERRPYGTELQLCQRYYEECMKSQGGNSANFEIGVGQINFSVTKRAAPTMSEKTLYSQSATTTTTFDTIQISGCATYIPMTGSFWYRKALCAASAEL